MAIIQPTKKPWGKEFTADQKDENKTISSIRIKVEHTISGIRTQRGVSGHCQLRKDRFVDKIFFPFYLHPQLEAFYTPIAAACFCLKSNNEGKLLDFLPTPGNVDDRAP